MIIDSHHHLWNPARGDYVWMDGLTGHARLTLHRPFALHDVEPIWKQHGIGATILVQAAPSVAESEYLLGIADSSSTIAGVIGWINFENPNDVAELARLAKHPKFLGVRPMIQDIPDTDWMLRDAHRWAYESLIEHDLVFEALGFPIHLDNFSKLFARYPDMRIVLDHCMKPQIRDQQAGTDAFTDWAAGMKRLANETSAICKFSALVTEAQSADWTVDDLRPFTDHVIEVFGPDRLIWGSDWPVCLLASEYGRWMEAAHELTSALGNEGQKKIFAETADRFYRLQLNI